ncbi:hypothetical protein BJX68DRAFT_260691 [Aspergillus pseudodeflectus]|uniref:Uncharacterized protein n=1 Tax=Aspergillus pseudodeflectus TaxID=176178 RepID=A0ABR4LBI4_9EURO
MSSYDRHRYHKNISLDPALDNLAHLTIYLGPARPEPGNPLNMWLLVLATPDFKNSLYNFIMPPFEQRAVGDSLVYQGRMFRFPFVPGGDTVPLPMQEVGKVHPLMREKILRIAAVFARKPEPWDQSFLHALEREGIVPSGTAVGYSVKLRELEKGGEAAVKAEVKVEVEVDSKGGASVDRVTKWLETLGMDDN